MRVGVRDAVGERVAVGGVPVRVAVRVAVGDGPALVAVRVAVAVGEGERVGVFVHGFPSASWRLLACVSASEWA